MSHFYSFKGNTQQLEKFKELEKNVHLTKFL